MHFKAAGMLLIFVFLFFIGGCGSYFGGDSDSQYNLGYKVYVPNMGDNSITVIPEEDSLNTDTIDMDNSPGFIVKVPGENRIMVLIAGGNEILEISTEDNTIVEDYVFEVGDFAQQTNYRAFFSSDGSKAYFLTSYESAGIAVMKTEDRSFIKGIDVDSTSLDEIFFSSGGDYLYCTDSSRGKIYVINTEFDELQQTIDVEESFNKSLYNPETQRFFLTYGENFSSIKQYDPATRIFSHQIENVVNNIVKMALSPDKSKLYVIGTEELAVIDLEDDTIEEIVALDYSSPSDLQFLPDGNYILVPSTNAQNLMIIKVEDLVTDEIIDVGNEPGEILIQ